MKRGLALVLLVLSLVGLSSGAVLAQTFPRPTGFVNDYAGLLLAGGKNQLESRLVKLEKDTSAELAVVTVVKLEETTIEEYAVGLFNDWGIGKSDKDNGVLLIMSLTDREVWIEVGYGLEPVITDGRAGRILDDKVIPSFRTGDYEQGITDGVIALEEYIRNGTPPSLIEENPFQRLLDNFSLPEPLVIFIVIISIYILGFMARTKSIWLGGIWGFIMGLVLGFGFRSRWLIFTLPVVLGIFGTLLDIILSRNYKHLASSGRSTGWYASGGGFSGGGSGFGGFGGGRSGGGGAGRGW
ncbi:MAG: TPM domain-containing protein [Dehalococcoidales bacterium]|nr:TPM domain-containing protein [Dehalococcoidales bacterium]